MPLQPSLAGEAVRWLAFGVASLVPGLVAAVLWTPFLAAARVRALFAALPPSGSVLPTHLLVGVGASVPYVAGFLAILAFVDSTGTAWSAAFLDLGLSLAASYVVGLPVVAAVGLPRLGVDWDPSGYGRSTWLVLAAGSAWYALLFTVPLAVLSLLLAWPGGY